MTYVHCRSLAAVWSQTGGREGRWEGVTALQDSDDRSKGMQ